MVVKRWTRIVIPIYEMQISNIWIAIFQVDLSPTRMARHRDLKADYFSTVHKCPVGSVYV